MLGRVKGSFCPRTAVTATLAGVPLIILRFGADKEHAAEYRTSVEGTDLPPHSAENNFVLPEPIEGSSWSL